MSKTNHTPEPWKAKENHLLSLTGKFIGNMHSTATSIVEDRGNAQRIVQCVNAMAGIEDPNKLRQTFEAVRHLKLDAYPKMKEERDQLQSWKNDAELAHNLLVEALKKREEIISGLLQEYKEFIADCEVPPSRMEFLNKAENLINKKQIK